MNLPEIIYEDEDILAINKPAGLIVHPSLQSAEQGESVSDWFIKKYPEAQDVGEPIRLQNGHVISRPGIVHRLDRDTSGVLLLAKTDKGHKVLKRQFQNRKVEKFYQAFVLGLVKDDRGTISFPIGKSKKDFRKWSAERGARGLLRQAVTYFEVLKRDKKHRVTLVEVKPRTGRTHQIRVHLKALQHPILGDALYGTTTSKRLSEEWGFTRLALHARKIIFENTQKERVELVSAYPDDFKGAIDKIGLNVVD